MSMLQQLCIVRLVHKVAHCETLIPAEIKRGLVKQHEATNQSINKTEALNPKLCGTTTL